MNTKKIRDEFPVTKEWVFLNHASVAPLTRRARDRIRCWVEEVTNNGNVNEADWWHEFETIRSSAAQLLGARTDEIAFLKNTSEGLAAVAEGFPWNEGDNVVLAAGEFPANVYPWMNLQSRGVATKIVQTRGVRIPIEDIAKAIDSRTRLLSISFVQFATGFRSDLVALGKLCKDRDIDFCVDAIQGLGVFPIDVKECRIDYLAADGHKWLLSPEGLAIFFIKSEKTKKIRPTGVGWKSVVGWTDFSTIDYRLKEDASRFESGTLNTPGLLGLGASLSLFHEIGIPEIRSRVQTVTDHLVGRLEEIGAEIVSSRDGQEWSGIVSFLLPGTDPLQVVRDSRQQKIVFSARDGRLRVSPHFYNDTGDIDRLIEMLKSLK